MGGGWFEKIDPFPLSSAYHRFVNTNQLETVPRIDISVEKLGYCLLQPHKLFALCSVVDDDD